MMPPIAGDTTRSTSPNPARIRAASARHSRSLRAGSSNTRIFWRKIGERSPEERMKWPSKRAPAARNSASTSTLVGVSIGGLLAARARLANRVRKWLPQSRLNMLEARRRAAIRPPRCVFPTHCHDARPGAGEGFG